jgi:diguanylate cyclase
MSDSPTNWRDKYLNALDIQEQLEKQLSTQKEVLRRSFVHLSAAVAGQDSQLDEMLTALKERLRTTDSADLTEQLARVERHLELLETGQGDYRARQLEILFQCCQQLKPLHLPAPLRDRIHKLASSLQQHSQGHHQTLAALDAWRQLLTEALGAAAAPDTSLWQRLRGGKRLLEPPQPAGVEDVASGQKFYQSLPPLPAANNTEPDLQLEGAPNATPPPVPHEQQPVVEHISTVLHQLLDAINPTDAIRDRIMEARARIEKGLGWQQLAETLEDLRDILMHSYLAIDSELSDYLERVNEDLTGICQNLGLAAASSERAQKASEEFGNTLGQQMAQMNQSLSKATNLGALKQEVSAQIATIHTALHSFQKQQENSLSGDLQVLLERVKAIESQAQKTQTLLERERHRATHDSLTELPNREAYNQRIKMELQRYKRYSEGFSLAVCDIDLFKKFNDNFGHQVGDRVLKLVSKALAKRLREVDFVARYGGEEFVIIMPHTPLANAIKTLDKIRAAIASLAFRFRDEPVRISLSFGLTQVDKDDQAQTVFARADKALYMAKQAGRNCCKWLPEEPAPSSEN